MGSVHMGRVEEGGKGMEREKGKENNGAMPTDLEGLLMQAIENKGLFFLPVLWQLATCHPAGLQFIAIFQQSLPAGRMCPLAARSKRIGQRLQS